MQLLNCALLLLVSAAAGHPGHSDVLSIHQLRELAKKQDSLSKCDKHLAARHPVLQARVAYKRSELFPARRDGSTTSAPVVTSIATGSSPTGVTFPSGFNMTGAPGGGSGANAQGTTRSATATANVAAQSNFQTTSSSAAPASATTQAVDNACALMPEQEEGPYYVPGELIREDLIEDQPGIPFYAELAFIDTNTCAPLVNAAIDIWSCNATGEYAGFISSDSQQYNTSEYSGELAHLGDKNDGGSTITDSKTWLRGQQLTDSNGTARFTTLVPGWYSGRAAHIHVRVHVGGELTSNGTYVGGNLTHTGQTFFGEDFYSQVANVWPYTLDTNTRTTNAEDRPYSDQNGYLAPWNLYYVNDTDITQGVIGYVIMGVDSTASDMTGYSGK